MFSFAFKSSTLVQALAITSLLLGTGCSKKGKASSSKATVAGPSTSLASSRLSINNPADGDSISTLNDSSSFQVSGSCTSTTPSQVTGQSVSVLIDGNVAGTGVCNNGGFTATIDTSLLAEGSFHFTASITDKTGKTSTSSIVTITKDITPPTFTISSPSASSINASSSTAYTLTFTDARLGTLSPSIINTGVSIAGSNQGCSKTTSVSGKVATVTITGCSSPNSGLAQIVVDSSSWTDLAGNPFPSPPTSNSFLVNNTSPVIAITSILDGDWINLANTSSSFAISGTCTESDQDQLDGQSVTLMSDGSTEIGNGTCLLNGTFNGTINTNSLSAGNHTLTAKVNDKSGNLATSSSLTIKKDVIKPTVTITGPNGNSPVNSAGTITYTLNFSDANLDALDNSTIDSAINLSGSTASATNGCIASTSGSNSTSRTVSITQCNGNGDVSISLSSSAAKDLAGNPLTPSSTSSSFTAVNTGPSLSISVPTNNSWINASQDSASFTVSGSCLEADQNQVEGRTVAILINGQAAGSATCSGGAFSGSIDTTAYTEGLLNISASVTDAANYTATASNNVTKDVTPPSVTITGPTGNNPTNAYGNTAYSITISDTNLEVLNDTTIGNAISITGTGSTNCSKTVKTTTGITSVSITNCSGNGNAGLSIASSAAADKAGNSIATTTASSGFTVNNTLPNIEITSPVTNSWINHLNISSNMNINGTCTEVIQSQVEGQSVSIAVDTNAPITTTCSNGTFTTSIDPSTLSEGTHSVTASIIDKANNSKTSGVINFSKDSIRPTLTILGPVGSNPANASGSTTYTLSFLDTNLGTLNNSTLASGISLGGSDTTDCTSTVSGSSLTSRTVTVSGCTGNGTVSISAASSIWTDAAGNALAANVDSSTFTVNNTLPSIAITSPANNSFLNSLSILNPMNISGSCSESVQSQVEGQTVTIVLDSDTTPLATPTCTGAQFSASIDVSTITGLQDGLHTLVASITDQTGNSKTSTIINFVKDTLAPSVTITGPSGSNPANSSASTTYSLTFADTNLGSLNNSTINSGIQINGTNSGCTATVTGTGANARTVTVTGCNGNGSASISILSSAWSDLAGNALIAVGPSSAFSIVNDGPSISINTIGASNYINSSNTSGAFAISGTCTESNQSMVTGRSVSIKIDTVTAAAATCTAGGTFSGSVDTNSLNEGSHTFEVSITDTASNSSSATKTAIKDVTAPTVTITGPTGSTVANSSNTTTYTLTFSDSNLGTLNSTTINSGITLTGTGTAGCTKTTSIAGAVATVNITGCSGSGNVGLTAGASSHSDLAGNAIASTSASTAFTVNNTAPTIAISTPANNSYINTSNNSASFTISGTCTGPTQTLVNGQTVSISVDGVSKASPICTAGAFSTTVDVTGLTTGSHSFTASITDASSLTSSASSAVTKDSTAPTAASTLAWTNGSTSVVASQPVTWVKSTASDLSDQKLELYSTSACTGAATTTTLGSTTATTYTLTLGTGTYSFKVVSVDTAGNTTSSSCSSSIVITLPALSLSPGNFSYPAGATLNITFVGAGGSGSGYVYSVTSGSGTINSSTGVYSGGSRNPGSTTVVTVTDSASATASVTITHTGTIVNGTVNATATDANGNIYLGGEFTTVNPTVASSFITVNSSNGSVLDYSIAQGFNSGATINAVALSGGFAFVGGSFTSYKGTTVQNIAKINLSNGALDTTFTQTTGLSSTIYSLAVNGTALYIGSSNNVTYRTTTGLKALIKVDMTTGNLDTGFNCNINYAGNVYALLVANSGIYAGGDFAGSNGGTAGNSLIKASLTTGGIIAQLNGTTSPAGAVYALATYGTNLYVGGAMSSWKGAESNTVDSTKKYLMKMNWDTGVLDTTFNVSNSYPSGNVRALAITSDGASLYVGGDFANYRTDIKGAYLAKVSTTNGAMDTTNFNNMASISGTTPSVKALALTSDNASLYVGGSFTSYRSDTKGANLAKVSATTGVLDTTTFNSAASIHSTVNAIAISGSTLAIGGNFYYYRGTSSPYLAKFSLSNWALDTAFSQTTGANAMVKSLAVSGSSIYAGGDFTSYRGSSNANRIMKLDTTSGNLDTTFNSGTTGPNNTVNSIIVYGSSMVIAGKFTTYRGSSNGKYIAKLNSSTGVMDTTFNSSTSGPDDIVNVIAYNNDRTRIHVGGNFWAYRGSQYPYYITIDATTGALITSASTSSPNTFVYTLVTNGTNVYIGGNFITVNGNPRGYYVAKLLASSGAMDTTNFNVTSNTGPSSAVYSLALSPSGSALYIGGNFTSYRGSTNGNRLVKVNSTTGAMDTTFNSSTAGPDAVVNTILPSSDGTKIYVGGAFTTYRGDNTVPGMTSVSTTNGANSW